MKTASIILGTLLLGGAIASAQEGTETPKVEVGLNYSYTRINPGGQFSSYNANGGFADVAYNFNRYFAAVADLGGSYTGTQNGLALNNTSFEYLFGPRVNWRHSRFTPYAQALFGGQRFSNGFNPTSADPRLGTSQNNFAAAFGGGLDITVSNHLAVRPFQVEYLMTQIQPGSSNLNYTQNNFRYSAGVVLRLGSK
jgi:opacity protein-like surface antigen